jgi:hypothetical protein
MSLASGWHNYSKYFQIFADGYLIVAGYLLKYTINPFRETDNLS